MDDHMAANRTAAFLVLIFFRYVIGEMQAHARSTPISRTVNKDDRNVMLPSRAVYQLKMPTGGP